ncbi:diaminopimelate decarboxylase [Bacteroidia bacterium]|nr:diaminopimelate decarboxylase [Bacteroidia bacterium]GHT80312.1 diaminopimelate decarboxylase [Bacteroidia bacterium]
MQFPVNQLHTVPTPFYFYDVDLLQRTAAEAQLHALKYGYKVHYAIKANANAPLLRKLNAMGIGADCVSGNEVQRAIDCGFSPDHIAFAGVGKTDDEINLGIKHNIWCFNCESEQEIEIIQQLAAAQGKTARIALRINPNVDAHTHHYITTGMEENKFGIQLWQVAQAIDKVKSLNNVELVGLHFHIGSQITDMQIFATLCQKMNELTASQGVEIQHINLGGGLGVDYQSPDENPIPNFKDYFATIHQHLRVKQGQTVHVELGRSLVAQCGALIAKVLYVKKLRQKNFVILDAGMSDLIRPALYNAYHHIQNLTSAAQDNETYDVVGPICESSDCFAKDVVLPVTQRGDFVALRTAGAYGEVMASQYNLRWLPQAVYSSAST